MKLEKKGYISKMNSKLASRIIIFYILAGIIGGFILLSFTNIGRLGRIINLSVILILILLAIYQLVFANIKVKKYRGRKWGLVFIVMTLVNLLMIAPILEINIKINENYNMNSEVSLDVKRKILKELDIKLLDKELQKNEIIKLDAQIDEYKKESSNSVDIYYTKEIESKFNKTINNIIVEKEDNIKELLGIESNEKANFICIDSLGMAKRSLKKEMGFISPNTKNIYIISESLIGELEDLKKNGKIENSYSLNYENTLVKLYCNFLMKTYMKNIGLEDNDIPDWYIEGTSKFIADEITEMVTPSKVVTNEVIDFRDQERDNLNEKSLYSKKAAVFVKYIINENGSSSIFEIIDKVKDGYDFYEAIEVIVGKSYDEIDEIISKE